MVLKWKKVFAACLSVTTVATCMVGCSDKKEKSNSEELTYWMNLPSAASQTVSNMGDTPFGKELEKQTGIKIKWIHPAAGQQNEKFNLMVASGDMPDIVEWYWGDYAGGPDKAIEQGLIIDINDYKDKLPNYFEQLGKNEMIDKLSKTDTGKRYGFAMMRFDRSLDTSGGIIIREDWLKDLNLEMPETIDEWENVLTEFKNKKGATAPLSFNWFFFTKGVFAGAYNTSYSYYLDGDVVKYGPLEDGFKAFLQKMNVWYKKGLLDSNFATITTTTSDSNILNGISGATFGGIGGGIGKLTASNTADKKFKLSGAPFPVLNKGDYPEFGYGTLPIPETCVAAINAKSDKKEAALKLLDFGYGEKGHLLYNFGVEGDSYTMVDGQPIYADKIVKNSEGKSMSEMLSVYARSTDKGPYVQDERFMQQYANTDEQKQAWNTWMQNNSISHALPFLYVTVQESEEFSSINTSLSTYVDEMVVKFIMGKESFDNYDKFIKQLNERGAQKAVKIKQDAYDRYLER